MSAFGYSDGGTLFLGILFVASGVYSVVGNVAIYALIKLRGGEVPFVLGGLAVLEYFFSPPTVRSRRLDWFALSVALSSVVTIVAACLLYPRIWS